MAGKCSCPLVLLYLYLDFLEFFLNFFSRICSWMGLEFRIFLFFLIITSFEVKIFEAYTYYTVYIDGVYLVLARVVFSIMVFCEFCTNFSIFFLQFFFLIVILFIYLFFLTGTLNMHSRYQM